MKLAKKLFLSAALASTMNVANAAECDKVSVGAMGWASGETLAAIATFLMEQGYGCDVTVVPTDTVPAVTSMAENNEPDVVPEIWQNSVPVYTKLEKEGKVKTVAKVFADGGVENWWIPKYLAEKHPELTTIEGVLANPELVGGRFHNCPTGWGCRIINDNLVQAFDLAGNDIEVFNHGSGANLSSSIASAFADEAPWFGYYWGPTAVLGKYEMVPVSLGDYKPEIHACNKKEDCATPGKSAYPSGVVVTGVTDSFAQEAPVVVEFLSKMSLPNSVINKLLAWKEDNNASADETAAYFLQNYKDLWSTWLSADAKENLSSLL